MKAFLHSVVSGSSVRRAALLTLACNVAFLAGTARSQAIIQNQPAFTDDNFDQWVFQNHRNAEVARRFMVSQLTVKAEEIERICKLNAKQKEKLLLAGHGDINRFFDRYHELKYRFQELRNDRNNINQIFNEIRPLQTALQSEIFHEDSLLQKSLNNFLDEEQLERYEQAAKERQRFRHRAKVELTVALFERGAPFTQKQREQLIEFLLSETMLPSLTTQYDHYIIISQVAKMPEDRVKPFFSEMQWKVAEQLIGQSQQMQPMLRQLGIEIP